MRYLLAFGLCSLAIADSGPADTRAVLARWVETQQVLAKEAKDWQQGKELLEARIALLQGEIAAVEQQLGTVHTASADSRGEQARLVADGDALRATAAVFEEGVVDLEARVRGLYRRLPDPAREKIQPLYARMPADPRDTKVFLAERVQNVVGMLNELNKLDNEVTLVTEVRQMSDGKPAEVRAIYLGLAQAYFVGGRGEAGVGRPGEDGWQWETSAEIAPAVLDAVEVLQSKAKPKFVPLPVRLR
ncbi:MAG TPA: DUF3450 family protein [Candidatus Polarisedimenticolaceae bacterium]|nr:DUF3450 family protein [Candidatus Polarisedimenticolaceae bacterium]